MENAKVNLDADQRIKRKELENKFIDKSTGWFFSVFMFITGAAGGGLTLYLSYNFSSTDISQIQNTKWFLLLILLIGASICTLFFFLYKILLKNLAVVITDNHLEMDIMKADIQSHLNLAKEVPSHLQNKLEKQIESAKQVSMILRDLKSPFLIHWDSSAELELNAKQVYSVSTDFAWLEQENKLERVENFYKIIFDAIVHPTDVYFFLAADKPAQQKIKDFLKTLKKVSDNDSSIGRYINKRITDLKLDVSVKQAIQTLDKRVSFRSLLSIEYYKNKDTPLPLPSDIVLYEGTFWGKEKPDDVELENFIVVSTLPVKKDNETKVQEQFDALFKDKEQVRRFKHWFEETWAEAKPIKLD